jgi:hypothetical protein
VPSASPGRGRSRYSRRSLVRGRRRPLSRAHPPGYAALLPAGIDCAGSGSGCSAAFAGAPTGCTGTFPAGTRVGLIASPASPSLEFVGFSAPCTDVPACALTVSANANVTAGLRPRVQTLTLDLQPPAGRDDGAILLPVTGPSILAIRPSAGLELAESRDAVGTGGTARSRMLLRGPLPSGALLQIDVPGRATVNQYSATV